MSTPILTTPRMTMPALGLGTWLVFNLPVLRADCTVHVGADELVVLDAAPVAVEGDPHAFTRAIAN